jgi:hypothetical protein
MRIKTCCLLRLLMVSCIPMFAPPAHADSCDEMIAKAHDATQKFLESSDIFRTRSVDSIRHSVNTLCNATDKDQAFDEESAKSNSLQIEEQSTTAEKSSLDDKEGIAEIRINAVLTNDRCAGHSGDLADLLNKVHETKSRNERLSSNLLGSSGNGPAFDKFKISVEEIRNGYFDNNKQCAPNRDYKVGDLKPDCVDPDHCVVIELKPDNRCSDDLWKNATQISEQLNSDGGFNQVADNYGDFKDKFSKCKSKFKARIDCYHYCPEVDDEGHLKDVPSDWSPCRE